MNIFDNMIFNFKIFSKVFNKYCLGDLRSLFYQEILHNGKHLNL